MQKPPDPPPTLCCSPARPADLQTGRPARGQPPASHARPAARGSGRSGGHQHGLIRAPRTRPQRATFGRHACGAGPGFAPEQDRARPPANPGATRHPSPWTRESVPEFVRRMVESLNQPAYMTGRRWDLLVWNAAAARVFADFAGTSEPERNILLYMFTQPAAHRLFADAWSRKPDGCWLFSVRPTTSGHRIRRLRSCRSVCAVAAASSRAGGRPTRCVRPKRATSNRARRGEEPLRLPTRPSSPTMTPRSSSPSIHRVDQFLSAG